MSLRDYFDEPSIEEWGVDTIGATAVLVLALVLFPLRFYVSQSLAHTIPIVVGVASGAYLLLERHGFDDSTIHRWRVSPRTGHVLRMTVLVGFAGMLYTGVYTGGRTIPFFGVAALVGTLVFVQILFLQRRALEPTAVLVQIVTFALIVRGVALVTTPGLIGVDSWIHLPDYASSIRASGELAAIADTKYFAAPLYHLLVVVAAETFSSSLRTALFASLGIVMPLSVLLLYCTSRFFLTVRWALFATASFAVADHVVRWGIHIIPTSMGLVFFLGVFYGVGKISTTRGSPAAYGLVLLFAVATILTHQISTFIVLVFLGAGAVANLYLRLSPARIGPGVPAPSSNHVNFVALLLAVLPLTIVNWSLAPRRGRSFLAGMTDSAFSSLGTTDVLGLESASTVDSESIESMMTTAPMSVEVFDSLGFLLLLIVALVGAFTLLNHHGRELLPLTWLGSTATMLFVVLGLPLFGLYFLIPMRWYAFLYVPMVVLGAYGIRYFESNVPARHLVVVLLLFSLLFPGAMLVNHKSTHDDPVHDDYYHRFAYTDSELAAAQTISTIHPAEQSLRTDHPFYIYLRDAKGVQARPMTLTDSGSISDTHVVYREYQTDAGPKVSYGDTKVRVKLSSDEVCRPSMDVLYANGDVRYCRSPTR